jgi:hypothetical protein
MVDQFTLYLASVALSPSRFCPVTRAVQNSKQEPYRENQTVHSQSKNRTERASKNKSKLLYYSTRAYKCNKLRIKKNTWRKLMHTKI